MVTDIFADNTANILSFKMDKNGRKCYVSTKDETKVLNIMNGTVLKQFLKRKSKLEVEESAETDSFIEEEMSGEESEEEKTVYEDSESSTSSSKSRKKNVRFTIEEDTPVKNPSFITLSKLMNPNSNS